MIDPETIAPTLRIGRGATPRRQGSPLRTAEITIRNTAELTRAEQKAMCALLQSTRSGTSAERFKADLAEQRWALLLRDPRSGELRGFSTLARWRAEVDGQPVVAFASGDTLLEGAGRGGNASAGVGRLLGHALRFAAAEAPARTYWLLVRSRCDAWRMLRRLFRDFHAAGSPSGTSPPLERTLEALIRARLPGRFEPEGSRVLDAASGFGAWIAAGTGRRGERSSADLLRIAPTGERYASLALLSAENLTPLGRRLLRRLEAPSADPSRSTATAASG
ncbi:MAG: hypothetical protein ACR2F9_07765 [Longimicrobiaceae bacterium]